MTVASGNAARWGVANPVAVLTAAGLLVYGLLYLIYAQFYDAFGLQPEDAGLGYKDILSRAPFAMVVILGEALVFVGIFAVCCGLWWLAVHGGRWVHLIGRRVPTHPSLRSFVAFSCVYSIIVALAVVFGLGFSSESTDAGNVYWEGTAVAPGTSLVGYVATPAAVRWLTPPSHHLQRLLYLGQTTNTYVLYDPRTRKTIDVPEQAVILSLHEPCTGACGRYLRSITP
jgi:hypothetical protein